MDGRGVGSRSEERTVIIERVTCKKGSALRARFWFDTCAGLASLVGSIVTHVLPNWVELAFGIDPDGHTGQVEWMIVTSFAIATVGFRALARAEWNRRYRFALTRQT